MRAPAVCTCKRSRRLERLLQSVLRKHKHKLFDFDIIAPDNDAGSGVETTLSTSAIPNRHLANDIDERQVSEKLEEFRGHL